MMRLPAATAAALLLLSACEKSGEAPTVINQETSEAPKIAPVLTTADAVDPHSYAKPLEARVTHVALDLGVDFDTKRVSGTATLDIDRKPDAKEIILDDKGLEIQSITDGEKPLQYKIGAVDEDLGAPLAVTLNPDTKKLVIAYKSAPNAQALQWLSPQQTAGKQHPYLFSQGEAIYNRTWIPTQDSPGIRQSWEANIHVPATLTAVMSAPRTAEPLTQGGETVFSFNMDKPVAPYLIAIAVGDLKFRSLGKRTGVWTEPSIPTLTPSTPMSSITARTCATIIAGDTGSTATTVRVFCAVIAVIAVVPCTPARANAFRSAWIPAPPPESEPAIDRHTGMRPGWDTAAKDRRA